MLVLCEIAVAVVDAGRTLIQVVDNGKGMSEEDAKLCFKRHATSKISAADDLLALVTKGLEVKLLLQFLLLPVGLRPERLVLRAGDKVVLVVAILETLHL